MNVYQKAKSKLPVEGMMSVPMELRLVPQILVHSHADTGTVVLQGTPVATAVNGAADMASAAPIGSSGSS